MPRLKKLQRRGGKSRSIALGVAVQLRTGRGEVATWFITSELPKGLLIENEIEANVQLPQFFRIYFLLGIWFASIDILV